MNLTLPAGAFGATDPLFLLLAALAIEAYAGDILGRIPKLPHPRAPVVHAANRLERRLNRPHRSQAGLMLRGGTLVSGLALASALVGVGAAILTRHFPYLWLLELLLLIAMLGQRPAWRGARSVSQALVRRDPIQARHELNALAGDILDPDEIQHMGARQIGLAAVAGLGERFASAVVAPAFWYVLLGLPGLFAQQAVRSVATVIATSNRPGGGGYRRHAEGDFAFLAVRLDAALDWIPDKLAGVILAVAAVFIPSAHPITAFRRLPRGHWWSIAAIGGALHLAARRNASLSAAAAPDTNQVNRAIALFAVGSLIHGGLLAGLLVLRQTGVAM